MWTSSCIRKRLGFKLNPIELLRRLKTDRSAEDFEIRMVRKDGSTFVADMNAHFVVDPNVDVVGLEGCLPTS